MPFLDSFRTKSLGKMMGWYALLAALLTVVGIGVLTELFLNKHISPVVFWSSSIILILLLWMPLIAHHFQKIIITEQALIKKNIFFEKQIQWDAISDFEFYKNKRIILRDTYNNIFKITSSVYDRFTHLSYIIEFISFSSPGNRAAQVQKIKEMKDRLGDRYIEEVISEVIKRRGVLCPVCRQKGNLREYEIRQVMSAIFVSEWKIFNFYGCPKCLRRFALEKTLITFLTGWWGIPNGLLRTPLALYNNFKAIKESYNFG